MFNFVNSFFLFTFILLYLVLKFLMLAKDKHTEILLNFLYIAAMRYDTMRCCWPSATHTVFK